MVIIQLKLTLIRIKMINQIMFNNVKKAAIAADLL